MNVMSISSFIFKLIYDQYYNEMQDIDLYDPNHVGYDKFYDPYRMVSQTLALLLFDGFV
jgi:hypothetical protein